GLVWVTYRLARLVADRPTATLAAAFTALSPYQLMYAQEARTYTLVALWMTLSLYLFARAVLLGQSRAWLPFVLVSALGLWTQTIALLGVLVQAAIVIGTPAGRRHGIAWMLAQLGAVLLFVPWIFIGILQTS